MPSAQKPSTGPFNPRRFDALRFAQAAATLDGELPLADLKRLAPDLQAPLPPDARVYWSARGEWRDGPTGSGPQPWLRLQVRAVVPLACQRCLGAVDTELLVDRWFRFVADEAAAEAQDDDAEEDLLALEPRPDLFEVIEDELIMALPLVPMHEACPETPAALQASAAPAEAAAPGRPNPFAALQQLKGRKPGDSS
ncbi:YceD family protein [Hydrogenophaga sp. T2]|uniref:YceD family protein n=1 Tax=Hydrogenophaga sp. T2 TaxID=3132823 RepID=UPI003CFA4A69